MSQVSEKQGSHEKLAKHELSLLLDIPKEILEFEVNELDFEELVCENLEKHHEHSLDPCVDTERGG